MLLRFVFQVQQLRGGTWCLSDAHTIIHFGADRLRCKQWEEFFFFPYLFSPFCLTKSNYVCIRLSTGLFLCRTIELPPTSPSHVRYVILSSELGSKATIILQLGPEMLTCPFQKENGASRKENCKRWVQSLQTSWISKIKKILWEH